MTRKRPHDIEAMLSRIREAVQPYPKAALFELRDEGWDRVFHQLVACIISIRTRDEQTLPIARALFDAAPTARALAALRPDGIDKLIHDRDRKSTRLNSSHLVISYAVFCLK